MKVAALSAAAKIAQFSVGLELQSLHRRLSIPRTCDALCFEVALMDAK